MSGEPPQQKDQRALYELASQWVVRQERGLTPAEQDELSNWLAADPRQRAALGACRWGWGELDRLAGMQASVHAVPDPDLLIRNRRNPHRVRWFYVGLSLAAAAAMAVGIGYWPTASLEKPALALSRQSLSAPCERRVLADGTVVELNRGAKLAEAFTVLERRVHLQHGEAHFNVAKDSGRPFIVDTHGIEARAVGTAFNVKLDSTAIEVLVTEGRVRVGSRAGHFSPPNVVDAPVIEVGQRAVVPFSSSSVPRPRVATLSAEEMEASLAWQPRLLDFTDETLSRIVAAFNRHNQVRLVVADPSIADAKLSASFRSDNVAGFLRLMDADFGVRAEWRGESEVLLFKKP